MCPVRYEMDWGAYLSRGWAKTYISDIAEVVIESETKAHQPSRIQTHGKRCRGRDERHDDAGVAICLS